MNENSQEIRIELEIIAGQPTVSSLAVAGHFGKKHKNVLQIIRSCRHSFQPQ